MIGFLALLFAVAIAASVFTVWKYRRDLILGYVLYLTFKFYLYLNKRRDQ